jgi:LacI family transcriptional regulator/LacI family repressor for deo operon, udp, cdd, tsx, nupC, and nupG
MPMEAGGRAAVDLLLSGIDGATDGAGPHRELTTNLIVRATTAAARDHSVSDASRPVTGRGRTV